MRRLALACVLAFVAVAWGVERFPPPDFTDHQLPLTTVPAPRALWQEWTDVGALALGLVLASWLALRRRSRRGMVLLTIAALAYFGFYRRGCVCSIGAIQNAALALADASYVIPLTVVAFLLLPLAFALVFGRVFCSGVCPLGAIQDLVLLRPVKVPRWLEHALGLLRWAYLGTAVLLAATGAAFIICQYDPFVTFFRLSGPTVMLVLGASVLVVGMFVGRPFCRFACPYAPLLGVLSRLSRWRTSITPDECIRCRLCEDVCPFNAIDPPTAPPARRGTEGRVRLAALLVLLPVLVAAGAFLVQRAANFLAASHPTVRLAGQVGLALRQADVPPEPAVEAFQRAGEPMDDLRAQLRQVQGRFRLGAWLLGGFLGLTVGGKLIALSVRRTRTDYQANPAACVACGRCFRYCPREQLRRKARSAPEQPS